MYRKNLQRNLFLFPDVDSSLPSITLGAPYRLVCMLHAYPCLLLLHDSTKRVRAMKINPPIYIMLAACDSSCAYLAPNALELLYLFIFLPKMFSVTSAVPGNCYITRICTSSKVTTILPISQLQLHHHTTAFPLDVPSSAPAPQSRRQKHRSNKSVPHHPTP